MKYYKVEVSKGRAAANGISNGDPVIVESAGGRVEAVAMVMVHKTPFKHRAGLNV